MIAFGTQCRRAAALLAAPRSGAMPQSRRAAAASTLHGSAACRRRAGLRGTASEAKRVTATNMKKLRQRHAKSAKSPGSLRSPGIAANLHRPASAVPASQCSMAHTASYQRMRGGRSRWRVRIRAAAHTMDSSTRRESSPRRQTLIAIPQASRSTAGPRTAPLLTLASTLRASTLRKHVDGELEE
jgi:hypothetical protein